MNYAAVMRGGETVDDLKRVLGRFTDGDGPLQDSLAQGLAFQKFRDDVRGGSVKTDIVDGEDVGMIQSGGCAGFLFEAAQVVGIFARGWADELQGDVAAQALVARSENLAHTAGANFLDDSIVPYESARH